MSNLIKKLLGKIPGTTELFWQLKGKNKPWAAHYRLEGLQDVFTDAVAEVEALRKQADKPKDLCFLDPALLGGAIHAGRARTGWDGA